jgi:hypothetical protein
MAKQIVVTNEFYDYLCYIRKRDFEDVKGMPISIPKMLFEIIGTWNNVRGYRKNQNYGHQGIVPTIRPGNTANGKRSRYLQAGEVRNLRSI